MNADYDRDGFLVVPDFLPAGDCDALQVRAAELVADFDPGPARTLFSTRDQGHYALHLIDRRAVYSVDNWLQRSDFPLRGFS
jgi:hypothetical protein